MRFSLSLSADPPDHAIPIAQAAEAAGFTALNIPDSLCYPKDSDSEYPYSRDGGRGFLEDKPFIDPFIQIARLAATTSTLRFVTAVCKLPVRQPVVVAKMLTSLAVVSGDRVDFGVGISPWKEDFAATQTPWEKRGRRLDQMIEILRGFMTGEYFSYESDLFSIPALKLCPAPSRNIPILIGGHSDAALERAARSGDGWIAAGGHCDQLKPLIERVMTLRKEYGRDRLPFEVHSASADAFSIDGVKRLAEIGVDQVCVGFHNVYSGKEDARTLDQKTAKINRFADEIMSKIH